MTQRVASSRKIKVNAKKISDLETAAAVYYLVLSDARFKDWQSCQSSDPSYNSTSVHSILQEAAVSFIEAENYVRKRLGITVQRLYENYEWLNCIREYADKIIIIGSKDYKFMCNKQSMDNMARRVVGGCMTIPTTHNKEHAIVIGDIKQSVLSGWFVALSKDGRVNYFDYLLKDFNKFNEDDDEESVNSEWISYYNLKTKKSKAMKFDNAKDAIKFINTIEKHDLVSNSTDPEFRLYVDRLNSVKSIFYATKLYTNLVVSKSINSDGDTIFAKARVK